MSGNLMSETDLFNDGFSVLPEDLAGYNLDPGCRLWLKWNVKQELGKCYMGHPSC